MTNSNFAFDEEARLAALARYEILDSQPEVAFDRLTQMAANLFEVPLALVSLVDSQRQWFKSASGDGAALLDVCETPREYSLCSHALHLDEPMIVLDATKDARFAESPLVTGPMNVRFYAGAPLLTPDGFGLGTLCIIDTKPRDGFGERDIKLLSDLAALAMDEIELRSKARKLQREIEEKQRVQSAAEQSEKAFRALTENARDIISVLRSDGVLLYQSPSVEHILGYTPEEMRGQNAFSYMHPDDLPTVGENMRRALEDDQSILTEFRFRHRDGEFRVLESMGSAVRETFLLGQDTEVAPDCLVVNSRDVTGRRREQERLRLLESVVVNANDAILITKAEPIDLENNGPEILYANEAFTRMTGYELHEVLGKTPRILQGPKTQDESRAKIRSALKSWKPIVVELVNYRKDGSEFWVELSIVPVADETGWYTHWVSIQRDIDERKMTERMLQSALAEAESANRAKSEFLSRVSHELRTPLNAILGFGQLLEVDDLSEESRESTEQIMSAGKHLLQLINEVLDLANIEQGRMRLSLEPVDVSEVIAETLSMVRPLAEQSAVTLREYSQDESRFVLADRQRLKQILLNLLGNAVKYNRDGGSAQVRCEEIDDGRLAIVVEDNGPGIAPEHMMQLFTPFERLGAEHTAVEGTGLGLALSKRLIEAMNGLLEASSKVGAGSMFRAILPRTQAPGDIFFESEYSREMLREKETGAPRKVLYIEDNAANLHLMQQVFRSHSSNELHIAQNGETGLEMAREMLPALILLDLHLPGIGGDEVLRRLQEDASTRAIPVVIVSADAVPRQRELLLHAGASHYLTKPIDINQLLKVVGEVLQGGSDS